MLMAFSGAALPSRVTLPATEPVVEASTVFPAGAAVAAGCSVVVLSLLPQPVMAMAIRAARARCENLLSMLENSSLAELRILTRLGTDGAGFLDCKEPAGRRRYNRQRQRRPPKKKQQAAATSSKAKPTATAGGPPWRDRRYKFNGS